MAVKRIIDTRFWTDDKVVDLFSPEDKLFMLYILTNPHTTQLGIYKINKKIMAFELGYSLETIDILLDRFENKYGIIFYSKETNEIAIKNYLKYSVIKGGKPVEDCLLKEIKEIKDTNLIYNIFNNINTLDNINITVKNIINNYLNDNDNENEVSSTNCERYGKSTIEEAYQDLKETILYEKEKENKICEWCGCKTSILHKHHYPIPKRLGGTETVNICSNCHNEFHNKEARKYGGLDINYESQIKRGRTEKEFQELYRQVEEREKNDNSRN